MSTDSLHPCQKFCWVREKFVFSSVFLVWKIVRIWRRTAASRQEIQKFVTFLIASFDVQNEIPQQNKTLQTKSWSMTLWKKTFMGSMNVWTQDAETIIKCTCVTKHNLKPNNWVPHKRNQGRFHHGCILLFFPCGPPHKSKRLLSCVWVEKRSVKLCSDTILWLLSWKKHTRSGSFNSTRCVKSLWEEHFVVVPKKYSVYLPTRWRVTLSRHPQYRGYWW